MILERYIARSLIGPFFLGFGVVTFLLMMEMLLDLLDLILGKGIPIGTVARLFLLALGWILALSVPCGVLVASLMTFGRMSQDNEIIALRASGVHLFRVLGPAVVLGAIVAIGLILFNNYVLPKTNYAYATLLQDITRRRPTAEIRAGVLIEDWPGYELFLRRLDDRTGEMTDVVILDATQSPQSPRTIVASRGFVHYRPEEQSLTLDLEDGEIHEAIPSSPRGEYRRLRFEHQTLLLAQEGDLWRQTGARRPGQREMSVDQMQAEVDRLANERALGEARITEQLQAISLASPAEVDRLDPEGKLPRVGLGHALGSTLQRWIGRTAPPDSTGTELDGATRRTIDEIRAQQRDNANLSRRIDEYRVEVHKKFSIPAACVVFVLLGAPLGMRARRGGLAAGFLSVGFFVFYYLCLIGGEQLADRELLSPAVAMWLPNVVLGAVGARLTLGALRTGQAPRRSQKAR